MLFNIFERIWYGESILSCEILWQKNEQTAPPKLISNHYVIWNKDLCRKLNILQVDSFDL